MEVNKNKLYHSILNKKQMSLIIGSLLGDGSISKFKEKKYNSFLEITHSENQLEYLLWKKKRFEEEGFDVKLYDVSRVFKQYRIHIRHKTCKTIFNNLRYDLYKNNDKTITRKMLNWLDNEGIAIWYMDDGSAVVNIDKKTGDVRWRAIHIATHSFTYEEQNLIVKFLKVIFNIDAKIYKQKKWFRLNLNATNVKLFLPFIESFVNQVKSMKYKLDFQYK